MLDNQPPPFCFFLESLVVVGVPSAAILYPVREVVQVYRLVHDGRNDILDGPLQRLRSYVQLVPPFLALALPNLGYGHMTVCPRRTLDGDDRLFQLPAEPVRIDGAENLLKVSRCSACLDGVFHVCTRPFS